MRYWWVNHKQTIKQEIAGSYLWSPQTEAGGKRSQFYENMRRAAPEDKVISYASGLIRYVGKVQDFARVVRRPPEFQRLGEQWSEIGWLLPVEWTSLKAPIRPREYIERLRNFLPGKYSPIHPITGNGNQKAYLAEVGQPIFDLLVPPAQVASALHHPKSQDALVRVDDALETAILADPSLDATTKRQLILARHGQGQFRARVVSRYKSCLLTGVESPVLLVASHIKPWRACADSRERLDGANGLLLAPHVDRLFDRGFLTFGDDGRAILSPRLPSQELERLGLAAACSKSREHFSEETCKYLAFHRKSVFVAE